MSRRNFLKRCFGVLAGAAVAPAVANASITQAPTITGGYLVPSEFASQILSGKTLVGKPVAIDWSAAELSTLKVETYSFDRVARAFNVRMQELLSAEAS